MDAPPERTEAPPPPEGEDGQDGVEVCLFDESPEGFSRAVRAISELAAGEPDPCFADAEVERLASSITFLREWRHFSYEPKGVSFTYGAGSASSRDGTHKITLPQFSSASVPQVTHPKDGRDNTDSSDFILFAGGNVWALDWCPRFYDKPCSPVNCEYLAVAAHPPGSSYHKLGMPLIGRGIIQLWCLIAPFEEVIPHQPMVACNKNSRRGRPRKTPGENNSVDSSSNPPKSRGRPRKRTITTSDDHSEPSPKRPRGRPRKYPPPIAKVEDSSQNSKTQDFSLIDPLVTSAVVPGDLALACVIPTAMSVESTPRRGRGRPRKEPIDKIKGSSGIEFKEDMSTAPICMEPKKKRGRPRKYPAPSNSKHVSGTDIELGKDTTCLPASVGCSLGPTGSTESSANLTVVAVDAALQVPSSSSAICMKKSRGRRGRGQPKKEPISGVLCCSVVSGVESQSMGSRETISNDPTVYVDNSLPSGQSNIGSVTSEFCSVSVLSCEGNVHTSVISDDSMLLTHISPKSSDKRESSDKMGRGRTRKKPLSSANGCLLASGTESPKTASIPTNSDNPTSVAKSDGEVIASNLGSIDAASPAHGLCNANCKEESSPKRGGSRPRKKPVPTECSCSTAFSCEEQKTQTTPKLSDNAASVENCKKESCPRKGGGQPTKESASDESTSLALSGEVQKMERSSTSIVPNNHLASFENSMLLRSSISEDMSNESGLIGSKSGAVGCEVMKTSRSNTVNDTSNCDIEHAQENQAVPVPFENSSQVIDEVEDIELAPFKESSKHDDMISSNVSPIPKDISLPRVILCLAHNGKVAWDIKWKPPLLHQSEQKSRLGFLAILLGNGSLEVWEVPSPSMIQKIYSSSSMEGTDPRFLKLQPVFRCARVKCGSRQSIPLTVDWSPSPHDMILAGCHDGTVALWKFTTNLSSQDSKPFMCVTAESVPIRALSWAPYVSEESTNTFVTAGEDGLKFWDLRDPYRPLWELTTAPRAVLSLHWLKDARGIVISLEDGTLKFLNLSRTANDVPVTGRPFIGTKTQGVSTYQLSEYLIWSVHASEITGYAAYCVADGTAVRFQLTRRFWEKEPGRNRVPYFLCGSLSEEKTAMKIGVTLQDSPLSNVPLVAKKGPKSCQDVDQVHNIEKDILPLTDSGYNCTVNPELVDGQQDGPDEGQETGVIMLDGPTMQQDAGKYNSSDGKSPQDFEVFPPKAVALHRLRWNMNKGSERWLCYGGNAGIIRCQRI